MKKTVTLTLASTMVLGLMAGCATTQSGSQSAGAADTSLADATKHTVETTETGNFSDEMKIPYAVDLSPEDGSDSVERQGDHAGSIYFAHPDFYNMESTDTLTILTNFQTIQQTSEWSCGVTSVLIGASRPQQIVENAAIVNAAPFTQQELDEIERIAAVR